MDHLNNNEYIYWLICDSNGVYYDQLENYEEDGPQIEDKRYVILEKYPTRNISTSNPPKWNLYKVINDHRAVYVSKIIHQLKHQTFLKFCFQFPARFILQEIYLIPQILVLRIEEVISDNYETLGEYDYKKEVAKYSRFIQKNGPQRQQRDKQTKRKGIIRLPQNIIKLPECLLKGIPDPEQYLEILSQYKRAQVDRSIKNNTLKYTKKRCKSFACCSLLFDHLLILCYDDVLRHFISQPKMLPLVKKILDSPRYFIKNFNIKDLVSQGIKLNANHHEV